KENAIKNPYQRTCSGPTRRRTGSMGRSPVNMGRIRKKRTSAAAGAMSRAYQRQRLRGMTKPSLPSAAPVGRHWYYNATVGRWKRPLRRGRPPAWDLPAAGSWGEHGGEACGTEHGGRVVGPKPAGGPAGPAGGPGRAGDDRYRNAARGDRG